jgi:ankyrin repeat protein
MRFPILTALTASVILAGQFSSVSAGEIHDAVKLNDVATVEKMLAADPQSANERDKFGDTPLLVAAGYGNVELATLLLARGAEVNVKHRDGVTPLHRAISAGSTEIAKLLIENKADAHARPSENVNRYTGRRSTGIPKSPRC